MGLEALKLLEGVEPGIGVVETDDEAHDHLVVLEMVEEGAAIDVAGEGPSHGMDDPALAVLGRIDFPKLLDADAEGLWIDASAKVEALEQRLGQRAAATLREQGETS